MEKLTITDTWLIRTALELLLISDPNFSASPTLERIVEIQREKLKNLLEENGNNQTMVDEIKKIHTSLGEQMKNYLSKSAELKLLEMELDELDKKMLGL